MPLTSGLSDVLLSHPCPHCGHKQEKKGSWFQTIGQYICSSCGQGVRMGYDDKGRLMVAISFNSDIGDSWEWADDPRYLEKFSALGIRIGVNYIVYAMTH